jgi:hypothetical protein
MMSERMVMLMTVVTMGKSERMVTIVMMVVIMMVVMVRPYLAFFNPSASLSSPGRNMS